MVATSNVPPSRRVFSRSARGIIQTKTHPRLPYSLRAIAGLAVVVACVGLVLAL